MCMLILATLGRKFVPLRFEVLPFAFDITHLHVLPFAFCQTFWSELEDRSKFQIHSFESFEGFIEGDVVECPFHNGQFNIKTGEVVSPPCMVPIKTYKTVVENGRVLIETE